MDILLHLLQAMISGYGKHFIGTIAFVHASREMIDSCILF